MAQSVVHLEKCFKGIWEECVLLLFGKVSYKCLFDLADHWWYWVELCLCWTFLGTQNLPAMWETHFWLLGQEDTLKKGMATHSSILAWRIPKTEEPDGLLSVHGVQMSWMWLSNYTLNFYTFTSFYLLDMPISFCFFIRFCSTFFDALVLGTYTRRVVFNNWPFYDYILSLFIPDNFPALELTLSEINSIIASFFWLVLTQYIFLHIFTFNLAEFLYLKCFSLSLSFFTIIYVCVCYLLSPCPTLCNPMDCSPLGSSVHGILQNIPFSRGSSWPRDWTWVSCIADRFFTIWVTRKACNHL